MNTTTFNLKRIGEKVHRMVNRAIEIIREHSHDPIPVMKLGYSQNEGDEPNDFATQGDLGAQDMYRDAILGDNEDFIGFGIVGEEGLRVGCNVAQILSKMETGGDGYTVTDLSEAYFTIDPLDGTKAYGRIQSMGVGTMIALVINGEAVVVFIGDANTGEVYGYVKGVMSPTRFRFGHELPLGAKEGLPLAKQHVQLWEMPHTLILGAREIVRDMTIGIVDDDNVLPPLFKEYEVGRGSIGTQMARLWSGQIGGMVLMHSYQTPWDYTPVIGLNKALGFISLVYEANGPIAGLFREYDPGYVEEVAQFGRKIVEFIIHESRLDEFVSWFGQRKCNLDTLKHTKVVAEHRATGPWLSDSPDRKIVD